MNKKLQNTFTAKQAKALLNANLANVARRLSHGKTLSSSERVMLEGITNGEGPSSERFANNQVELAKIFGCTRRSVQNWTKQAGWPGTTSNGRYEVAAIMDWLEYTGHQKFSHLELKANQLLLKNQKLEIQNAISKGEMIRVEDVEKLGAMIGLGLRKAINALHTIAPSIVGLTIPEIEVRLKDEQNEILNTLSLLDELLARKDSNG